MKVLVVGGTGFIGRHLCRTLRDRGHDVTALGRSRPREGLPDDVSFAAGDVTDVDTLIPAMADQDAVVHLVAVSPLFSPPGGAKQHEVVTVGGTRNVIRAMNETDVDRLVYLSGLGADPEGKTAFIRTKGRAEAIIRAADVDWTILRPSAVFGEGGEFISFVRLVTTPYVTGLPNGGSMRFQPIWVRDLTPLIATAIEEPEHVGESYDVGGPESLTLAEVTKLIYDGGDRPARIIPIPMPLARIGLTLAGILPLIPLGPDQYRSLTFDNTPDENHAGKLDGDLDSFTTLPEYLGATL